MILVLYLLVTYRILYILKCSYFSSFKSTFSQLDFKKLMQFSSILNILTNYKLQFLKHLLLWIISDKEKQFNGTPSTYIESFDSQRPFTVFLIGQFVCLKSYCITQLSVLFSKIYFVLSIAFLYTTSFFLISYLNYIAIFLMRKL